MISQISHQLVIDKIYLYANDPYDTKYQLLINKLKVEGVGIKHFNDFKAFIEYWTDFDDIYKNIE